ncbi:MAG: NADH-quinone oxidoreductase subunit NuoH [Gemmatimonas sp.]|nr:NADH-quinone oxidoreductase subunit NuoH [Gemmatimonas sp.]
MDQTQLDPGFWPFVIFTVIKMLAIFTLYMVGVAYTTLAERKISGWIQDRHGPNRVGPWGLFQVLADGVKNIMKEESMPGGVNKPLFILAPAIAFVPALIAWAVIPFAAPLPTAWGRVDMVVADLPIGFLYTIGIASLGVYGIVLAGWSSNNKYALLGGLRASAQMVSYEITMGMALLCVLLVSGNVSLTDIVAQQQGSTWNAIILSIAGFLFLVSAFAETNRVPFDMPEAESELIAGYHSEYSAMKFSMFPISEYANMVTTSAMFVTLFLGGWDIPFTDWDSTGPYTVGKAIATFGMFAAKTIFFVFFYIWVRWTLPRFRYDQLMSLGWKVMLPIALIYLVIISAAIVALDMAGLGRGPVFGYAMGGLNLVCLVVLVLVLDRGRLVSPASGRLAPDEVERLRRRAPMRATLAPEEIR